MSQYISVRETAQILGVSEKKVMDLIEDRKLQAYRIADQFLRLKRAEVMQMRTNGEVVRENTHHDYTAGERLRDFIYYNDFYIIALAVVAALLYVIFFTS